MGGEWRCASRSFALQRSCAAGGGVRALSRVVNTHFGFAGLAFYAFAIVYLFTALAVVCDDYFVASLELISERLNLSEDVAGAESESHILLRRCFAAQLGCRVRDSP